MIPIKYEEVVLMTNEKNVSKDRILGYTVDQRLLTHPEHDGQPLTVELREEFQDMLDLQLANKAETWHELKERLTIVGKLMRILRTKYQEDKAPKIGRIHDTEIASILNSLMYIKRVGFNSEDNLPLMVYDYDNGIYKESNLSIYRMASMVESKLLPNNDDNVRKTLLKIVSYSTPTTDKNVAVLGNGLYNISTGEFSEFTPEKVYLTKASVNWNPEAKCPDFDGWSFDGFLDEQFGNEEDKLMVYQILQYALLNSTPTKAFIYLYTTDTRFGNGTLIKLIRQLVGNDYSGYANIVQLECHHHLHSVYDKSFIYGKNNSTMFTTSSSNIKAMAFGDPLTVRNPGSTGLTVNASPLIIQLMDTDPNFKSVDDITKSHIRVLELKTLYSTNADGTIQNEQFLEWLAHEVLTMPLTSIIDSRNSKRIKGEIVTPSDLVTTWFNDRVVALDFDVLTSPVLFLDFQAYTKRQHIQTTLTSRMFVNRLKQIVNSTHEFTFQVRNKSIIAPTTTIDGIHKYITTAGLELPDSIIAKTKRSSAIERLKPTHK